MARIVRFKIIPAQPEDDTFMTTKHTITESIMEMTQETDYNGNVISMRNIPDTKSKLNIKKGVSAVGKISRQEAKVIILETDEGLTEEGLKEKSDDYGRKPIIKLS
jgi:hypothetical protein